MRRGITFDTIVMVLIGIITVALIIGATIQERQTTKADKALTAAATKEPTQTKLTPEEQPIVVYKQLAYRGDSESMTHNNLQRIRPILVIYNPTDKTYSAIIVNLKTFIETKVTP